MNNIDAYDKLDSLSEEVYNQKMSPELYDKVNTVVLDRVGNQELYDYNVQTNTSNTTNTPIVIYQTNDINEFATRLFPNNEIIFTKWLTHNIIIVKVLMLMFVVVIIAIVSVSTSDIVNVYDDVMGLHK